MSAIKNVSATFVAGATLVCLLSANMIHWHFALIMAVGCAIGGFVGARLSQRVSSHWLRIFIIVIGIGAAAYLGLREY